MAKGPSLLAGYALLAFAVVASMMWSPNAVVLGVLWLTGIVGAWFVSAGMVVPRALVAVCVASVALIPAWSRAGGTQPGETRSADVATSLPANARPTRPPGYVSRAEFGNAWPLTVEDRVLSCDQSQSAFGAILFSSGGRLYGVNGRAKSLGHPPIDPIWREARLQSNDPPLTRLPEEQRRRIFATLTECQNAGGGTNDVVERCSARARARFKLTPSELRRVTSEGVDFGWPPLTPTRVSIGPLIERGVTLCDRSTR